MTDQDGSLNQVFMAAKQTILLEVEDVMKSPAALLAMYALSIQIITNLARRFTFYCSLENSLAGSTSMKTTPLFLLC